MEEDEKPPVWRLPIFVAAVLAVIGIAGATTIYLVGEDLHAKDRAAIIAWRDKAVPSLRVIRAQLDLIVELEPRVFGPSRRSPALRAQLVHARALIEPARDRAHGLVTRVLEEMATQSLTGVGKTLEALSTLEAAQYSETEPTAQMRASFDGSSAVAKAKFAAGDVLINRLYCRARLPECV